MAPTSSAFIAPTRHTTAESALAQVHHIYNHQIGLLRDHMQRFVAGETLPSRVRNQLGLTAQDFAQRSQRDYLVELLQVQRRSSRRAPASW